MFFRYGEEWPAEIHHQGRKNQRLVNHQWGSSFADKSSSCVTHEVGLIMLKDLLLGKKEGAAQNLCQDWQGLLASCRWASWWKWSSTHSSVDTSKWGWMPNELGPESVWLYSSYQSFLFVLRSQLLTFSICHPSIPVILRAAPNVLLCPGLI